MKRIILLVTVTLGLSACGGGKPVEYGDESDSKKLMEADTQNREIEEDEVMMETKNVSYEGIVRPSGISIYMQGTHRLETEMETVLLLESETVDLETYAGKEVRVSGSVRPTVEEGGMIMRVERVEVKNEKETKEETKEPNEEEIDIEQPESEESNDREMRSSSLSSTPPDSAKISLMMNEKFGDEEWTQRYCSLHIGFCLPIHRNWWYKSFGATTSSLWHVEIGPEPLEVLGDGPLLINLFSDTVDEVGAEDGIIVTHGNFVVGYRAWSGDRHIEVSAPQELREAVEYITAYIEEG